ncbi:MAG: amino acid ABC transporter substrate-binding protein, partial [Proteobacteria bacterium]|nr:amino acid ABC transporter substrate-binding protein [Pseudomonadota bacterium]
GLSLWADKTNSENGLLGRKINLIMLDDQSNPQTAKELYRKLITEEKVDLLFGPYSSTITESILPITEQYEYPMLLTGAAADKLWQQGYKYAFGIFIPASRYSLGFLEMIAMNGLRNVAIVYADDSFSTNIAQGAREWGTKFGLNISLYESFKKGTRDLSGLARKVHELSPEALIVCGHLNESVDMRLALKNIHWHPRAYFATVGPTMEVYEATLQADAELAFSSSQWEPTVRFQANDHEIFLEPFLSRYNEFPTYHAAQAFATGQVMETAVNKAKSLERSKIRDMLATMDAMSIIGRYKVDKNGMQIRHFQVTVQRINGKKEIVWPESLATAEPVFK